MKTWLQNETQPVDAPPQGTLYEDVVYWSQRMAAHELNLVRKDERNIALGMYRLVIVDWLRALKYVTTTLTKIEWEFEKPHWDDNFSNIDNILKKLSPWRRNIGYYQAMISEAIARLFPPEIHAPIRGCNLAAPSLRWIADLLSLSRKRTTTASELFGRISGM